MSDPTPLHTPPFSPPSAGSATGFNEQIRIEPTELWFFYNHLCHNLHQKVTKKLKNVFNDYINHRTSFLDFEMGVIELIEEYPKAVWCFKTMLKVLLGEDEYLDKVRVRLIPDNNIVEYFNFLECLRQYEQRKYFFSEFKQRARQSFRKHQDLWEKFDEYFDNEAKEIGTDNEGGDNVDKEQMDTTAGEDTRSNEGDTFVEAVSKKQKTN